MLLPKINSKFILPLFIVFSNFWIYKIFTQNVPAGATLAITSLVIVIKTGSKLIILGLFILLFLQTQTTSTKNLVLLDNDEQRVQSERIRSYPLIYIDLGIKVIWLKPEIWIEQNSFIIALSRLEENLYSNLDINKYFFGGFPRNKPEDFEKFPFAYLPVFILGIFILVKKKLFKELVYFLVMPLLFLAYLGSDNKLGPFILFPFFTLTFFKGITFLETLLKNKRIFYAIMVVSVMLTFILQMNYSAAN